MRKAILFFLFTSSLFVSAQMSSDKWAEDIKYLQSNLTNKHYNLFAARSEADFTKDINNITAKTNHLTDFQIALKLQQTLAKQGDTHTNLSLKKLIRKEEVLPFGSYIFSDGLRITLTNQENKELIGAKILAINNFDLKTITDSLSTLFPNENLAVFKNKIPNLLPVNQVLKYFGFSKNDSVKIKYENNGVIAEKIIWPSDVTKENKITIKPKELSFIRESKKKYFDKKYFEKEKILYVVYNVCASKEEPSTYKGKPEAENLPSFVDFQNEVFKIIETNKVDKFIFDMRFNGGGSSVQGTKFIKKLAQNSDINKKGHLFVVLGRDTFSSAILNATDFEEETKAIFVGEETSGKPNHYGEIQDFELPNSKLKLTYSTYYFIRTKKKNVNTIKPDYVVETSFKDYVNGIDPVFEFIKNYK